MEKAQGMKPRGVRNNNPGNIRLGAKWLGLSKKQTDREFCQFDSPVYGLRALMKLISNYQKKYHLDTVREIISRWAPPNENDTNSYIKAVAASVGVNPDSPLDLNDARTMTSIAKAICRHENGGDFYSDKQYFDAFNLWKGK
jgi:hypothetical protein